MKTLLLECFSRISSLLSMEPCSGQQGKYQSKPVGNPSKEFAPSKPPSLYRIVAIFNGMSRRQDFMLSIAFILVGLWAPGSLLEFLPLLVSGAIGVVRNGAGSSA